MNRRPRRNHTPAFKAKVALAAVKGDRTRGIGQTALTTNYLLSKHLLSVQPLRSGRRNFFPLVIILIHLL
jgi:hypothetical protein